MTIGDPYHFLTRPNRTVSIAPQLPVDPPRLKTRLAIRPESSRQVPQDSKRDPLIAETD